MSEIERLRPTEKLKVIDLVEQAGVDVSDWANFNGKHPATNPKYCYDWAFIQSEQVVVLNFWYSAIKKAAGRLKLPGNMRPETGKNTGGPHAAIQRNRAQKMDEAISYAASYRLPVRVIFLDGNFQDICTDSEPSTVDARLLDPVPWAVTKYVQRTGDFTLTRGAASGGLIDQFILDDIADSPTERRSASGMPFVRSPIVRQRALERAKGRCEWCSEYGFTTDTGAIFLETHHVIPLSEGGKDRTSNVVALCPNHHREAHYGASRVNMRETLLKKIATV